MGINNLALALLAGDIVSSDEKLNVTQFVIGMECYSCHSSDELSDDRPLTEYQL